MWSIFWQLVVLPGTQTVTVVNTVFTSVEPARPDGPLSTVIACTLGAEPAGGEGCAPRPPPPPPPQPDSSAPTSAAAMTVRTPGPPLLNLIEWKIGGEQ